LTSLLGVLILFSSTGIRISQHWCGDQLVNAAFFGEATPCAHFAKSEESQCPMHTKNNITKKCCDQKDQIIEGNNYMYEFQTTQVQISFKIALVLVWNMFAEQPTDRPTASSEYLNHSPPLLASEAIVLLQTFLI
jgi:hypothetical protein